MKSVVILLSEKRSGSTMFQQELCRHPDISHISYTPHSNFETHHWLKAAVILDRPAATFNRGRPYRGYGTRSNARTYLLDCIRGNLPDYQPPSNDRDLIFDSWEALCDHYAQPVFFEKSPQYLANWASLSLLLEWSQQTRLPVRFIGLVRNPMAVMCSAQKQFHSDPSQRQFDWLKAQQNLLAFESMLDKGSYLRCRYEDLVAKPAEAFGSVLEFLKLQPCRHVGAHVQPASADAWRSDPGFHLRLEPQVAQMAQHFGYDMGQLESLGDEPIRTQPPQPGQRFAMWRNRIRNRVIKPYQLKFKHRD